MVAWTEPKVHGPLDRHSQPSCQQSSRPAGSGRTIGPYLPNPVLMEPAAIKQTFVICGKLTLTRMNPHRNTRNVPGMFGHIGRAKTRRFCCTVPISVGH
jgi:hypothetical protein